MKAVSEVLAIPVREMLAAVFRMVQFVNLYDFNEPDLARDPKLAALAAGFDGYGYGDD